MPVYALRVEWEKTPGLLPTAINCWRSFIKFLIYNRITLCNGLSGFLASQLAMLLFSCNLPAQIDLFATSGNEYSFQFMAKGGGSGECSGQRLW